MSSFKPRIHKGGAEALPSLHFADFEALPAQTAGGEDGFQASDLWAPAASAATSAATAAVPSQVAPAQASTGPDPAVARVAALERQLDQALGALGTALDDLSTLRSRILEGSSGELLHLVLAVAEQVIHCEVRSNPEIIVGVLQKALQTAISSDEYHVRVHPDDLAIVLEKKPLLLASISGLKNITVEGDAAVNRGGCLVESELGQVDASIEGQIDELRRQLAPPAEA